jgi:DNA-binding IclR family transcriptional regulator
VAQDPVTRQYHLGVVFYNFFRAMKGSYPITRSCQLFLQRLVTITGETVLLNIIDGTVRVCIDSMESPQALKASMPIGSRSPLHAGGSSKCLLAFCEPDLRERYLGNSAVLASFTESTRTDPDELRRELVQIAAQGYAVSLGERNRGLGSLSAPVFNHLGQLLASLSLAIPEIRFKDEVHRQFCLTELKQAAQAFSRVMGYESGEAAPKS